MLSLQALMCSPEPGDPQDAEVAKMYLNKRMSLEIEIKIYNEEG